MESIKTVFATSRKILHKQTYLLYQTQGNQCRENRSTSAWKKYKSYYTSAANMRDETNPG
jgi:hypothetical protein